MFGTSALLHELEAVLALLAREGLLLASVLLLFSILAGLGAGLGLPSLFWRTTIDSGPRRPVARFLVGLAVGALLGADALVGILVESRGRTWNEAYFFRWLEFLCLLELLLVVFIWLVRPSGIRTGAGAVERRRLESALLPLGAGVSLAVFLFLVMILSSHTPASVTRLILYFVPPLTSPDLMRFHIAAGALLLLGIVLYGFLLFLNRTCHWHALPAATAICVLLTVVSAAHGFVAFRWPAAQIPTYLAAFAFYAFLSAHFQRARVPDLEDVVSDSVPSSGLLSDDDVLSAWRQQHRALPVLVVLAADGGGVRSALWTTTVLTRLEEEFPVFARHLRLVTGASGGMLGATLWTATLVDPGGVAPPYHATGGQPLTREGLLDIAERGGLSAVASALIFRDVLPPPLRWGPDRGGELELAWEEHCAELRSPLSALAAGEQKGWRPSTVLSPMIVEDGRRLVIANLDLGPLLENDGPIATARSRYSLGGVQLFEKLPAAGEKLRASTAVRLQANFPWVLPSTELPPLEPGAPRLRVVDAGYYDESGVDLACLWIFHHREWLKENTAGVLLVQNRDTSLAIPRHELPSKHRSCFARGLDGVLTPISAVLRAWGSTAWYRDDAAVAALAEMLDGGTGKFFTTVVFELSQEAALSWSITRMEACEIRRDIDSGHNLKALTNLKVWWQSHQAASRLDPW